MSFQKYKRQIVMGGILAMLTITYKFRKELIGDLSKDKELLHQQTDVDGSNKIKDTIREAQLEYFRSFSKDKK